MLPPRRSILDPGKLLYDKAELLVPDVDCKPNNDAGSCCADDACCGARDPCPLKNPAGASLSNNFKLALSSC